MRKPYSEGLATHTGPESWVGICEDVSQALTGVRAGRVLSREITKTRVPTASPCSEGNTLPVDNARQAGTLRGPRPRACTEAPCARTGRARVLPSWDGMMGGGRGQGVAQSLNRSGSGTSVARLDIYYVGARSLEMFPGLSRLSYGGSSETTHQSTSAVGSRGLGPTVIMARCPLARVASRPPRGDKSRGGTCCLRRIGRQYRQGRACPAFEGPERGPSDPCRGERSPGSLEESFRASRRVEQTGLGCELSPFPEVLFQNSANPLAARLCDAPVHSRFARSSKPDFRYVYGSLELSSRSEMCNGL